MQEDTQLIEKINFRLTITISEKESTFNAILANIGEEFRIYLFPDERISFNKIVIQSHTWNNEIPFFCFGNFVKAQNAYMDGREVELDLSQAKLITLRTSCSSDGNFFYFVIDTYSYKYMSSNECSRALFYLNHPSLAVIKDLQLVEYGIAKEENKFKPIVLNTLSTKIKIAPNKEVTPYTAIVEYDTFNSEETIIAKNDTLLDLLSFYYGTPIETLRTVIQQNNITSITYRQPSYKLKQSSYRNMDLAYLSLHLSERAFIGFTKAITSDFSSIKLLHTVINDYIRAKYLDHTSTFHVLYSIIETLADTETNYFDDKKTMQMVFNSLFNKFIKEMQKIYKKKKGTYPQYLTTKEDIRKRWDDLANNLVKKPKAIHPVRKLIEDNNIDWEKLNRNFPKGKIKGKKIRNIKDLRDIIVHDRINDYTQLLDMININSKLSFAVCIIILKKLGITDVDFGVWKELSIMK